MFQNCGIIQIEKNRISEDDIFELATSAGARECSEFKNFHEIITKKEDFYKIKTILEKDIKHFSYSGIEWRASDYVMLDKEQTQKMIQVLNSLEELDDVQNIFTNANLEY